MGASLKGFEGSGFAELVRFTATEPAHAVRLPGVAARIAATSRNF